MAKRQTAKKIGIRETITDLAEQLVDELRQEELTPMEKLAFLRTLLPYAVGKLPNALVNYAIGYNGQPTSARIIETTEDGGERDIFCMRENN